MDPHRRGQSHRSSRPRMPSRSRASQKTKAAARSSRRALQHPARTWPCSGRRPELVPDELRPPPPLPLAPDDADEPWLLARGLRRPNGRRSDEPDVLRRVRPRRRLTTGQTGQPTLINPPCDMDSGPRRPNLLIRLEITPLDEDINTIVTPTAPAAIHTGPITRARAHQLNY